MLAALIAFVAVMLLLLIIIVIFMGYVYFWALGISFLQHYCQFEQAAKGCPLIVKMFMYSYNHGCCMLLLR
uniref:Uncharacterized protein n=1 Tax=Rhizophora mucronata TaxID=61149 RepID=A0A2P2NU71_RHIMU